MYIKPAAGRNVPDPEKGGMLPPEGRAVEPNIYWLRRLTDGDVVKVLKPAKKERTNGSLV